MSAYHLTQQATWDLDDIQDYFDSIGKPAVGHSLIDAIERQCQQLDQFPGIGRDRSDLAPGLRSVVVQRYLIFFRPINGGIEVVRILHGARNIDPSLFQP